MSNISEKQSVDTFLACPTPDAWVSVALQHQDILLVDHAQCEKKAASTALSMIYRYPNRTELLAKMSRLAREELRHFEQVLRFIIARGFKYEHLSPSRYAEGLKKGARTAEPMRLVDSLIIGAFIEARSCERFAKLAPHLDVELGRFYTGLLASESRHFQDYLNLAQLYADEDITPRVVHFAAIEAKLIESADTELRFHSGIPSLVVPT
jgi:tRNA 2-(methylsulfanyl)-N6-isopentenyladenosine37 hydroxylase